jgi:PAS domain S-box-containing protein
MWHKVSLSFRNKLLLLFFAFSLLPLIVVALIVTNTIRQSYKNSLVNSFTQNINTQEKLLFHFFESNKSWIKSIAAQDIILAEMEKYNRGEEITEDKLFTSLVSLRRENSFIERIFITTLDGSIVTSSTTDDVGKKLDDPSFIEVIQTQRGPYFGKITTNEFGKRIIRLSTPFIKRSGGTVIGSLVADFNIAVVNNLFDEDNRSIELPESTTEAYIIDSEAQPLTNLRKNVTLPLELTIPYIDCSTNSSTKTNQWKNYAGHEVFGIFECNKIDDIKFTLIISQDYDEALHVSNQLALTISLITISIGALLVFSIFNIAQSITRPIRLLQSGAQEFGKGNMKINIDVHTGDELEELATSFNTMADQVARLFENLKKQETELQKEKDTIFAERNKLKVIISAITDAVIAVDLNRNIITFNRAAEEMTNLFERDVINKPIEEIITLINGENELKTTDYCPINSDPEKKENIVAWKNIIMKVGKKSLPINLISGMIKDGSSINLGTILTIHDISHDKELEDMKLDFVSMAAHELRTPITSIRGYTSMLAEEINEATVEGKEEWVNLLSRVSISSEQLLALVENLLNVTKIEKGVLSIACKAENWAQCIYEIADVLKERAKNKNISLTVNEIKPDLLAYVDKMRINEVTTNLITNAINYTPTGGAIVINVRLSNDKQWIETSVKDNGQGIPVKAQSHLFEKFFRVSGPLEQGSKGNGLGLYISKSIVSMHGGKIWVISDAGKGAEFIFSVPVAA